MATAWQEQNVGLLVLFLGYLMAVQLGGNVEAIDTSSNARPNQRLGSVQKRT
jgi:hypothetical protein